jgi:hypothetical protein
VESSAADDSLCFKVRGRSAYLSLELPEVFLIHSTVAGATAKVVANGKPSTVALLQGQHTSVVQGSGTNVVYPTLVELRLSI